MNTLSRRRFLKAAGLGSAAALLAACQPKVVEKVVEKEVTKVVQEVVKETVIVEGEAKEVTKVVEKVVTSTPAAEAPMELTRWAWIPGASGSSGVIIPEDDCMIKVDLEKALNIKINTWWLERATYVEQLSTRFAGGEYVDYGGTNFGDTQAFLEQGLFGKITLTDLATYAPRYFMGLASWDDYSMTCFYGGIKNGVRYTYGMYVLTQIYPFSVGYRTDVLDKMGMQIPETLDEMDQALRKMVSDGHFKYAARFRGADYLVGAFREVSAAYGATHEMWNDDGQGGIIHGYVHPAHREGLKWVQEWYKAGLIHPESATTKNADYVAAWCQGEFGYLTSTTWYRLVPGGEHYDCLVQQGWNTTFSPAPKGPNGDYGYGCWYHGRPGLWIMRHVDKEPEKKAKILEAVELTGADPEWAEYVSYGKPEHQYRDEFGALHVKPAEELGIDPAKLGAGNFGFTHPLPQIELNFVRNDFDKIYELCGPGTLKYYPEIGSFVDWTPCKDYTELGATVNRWRLDFITGVKDPEKDWDAFVDEYMKMGGECQHECARKGLANQDSVTKSIRSEVEGLLKTME